MRFIAVACVLFFCALSAAAEPEPGVKRYLYLTTPDGAQGGGSGSGILVYDIDDGHKLVRRIDVPNMKEGVRGVNACAKTGRLYFTTSKKRLGCIDLKTDKILWEKVYDAGCDQAGITPDGKKLYVATGFWDKANAWMVIDGMTGDELKRIPVKSSTHNTIASLDGTLLFGAAHNRFYIIDVKTDEILREVTPVSGGHFPFTVKSDNSIAYISCASHVGMDVVDIKAGKVLHRVLADNGQIRHRTHGAGLTPDEKEVWLSDQDGKKLFIFDATVMPPVQVDKVDLSAGGHGWVAFSLDGQFCWPHTPDVIDVQTRKIVATLKDERGKPFSSSKMIEVQFKNGEVFRCGDRFGVGRATKIN